MTPELSNSVVTICRIVVYVLSAEDAEAINRRRTDGASIAARMAVFAKAATPIDHDLDVPLPMLQGWPEGAQAHIGNEAYPGQHYMAAVVAVRESVSSDYDVHGIQPLVNLQVFLDGNDVYWAQNVQNDGEKSRGTWHYPIRP